MGETEELAVQYRLEHVRMNDPESEAKPAEVAHTALFVCLDRGFFFFSKALLKRSTYLLSSLGRVYPSP